MLPENLAFALTKNDRGHLIVIERDINDCNAKNIAQDIISGELSNVLYVVENGKDATTDMGDLVQQIAGDMRADGYVLTDRVRDFIHANATSPEEWTGWRRPNLEAAE